MKIAHIVCTFPPYKGGMGNVVYEQAKELADLGHEVIVFTPEYKKIKDNTNNNFKIVHLRSFIKFGNATFLPQLVFKLKKFDVVQLHYPFFGATEVIWLARKLGLIKKLVIFYHMDFLAKNVFFKIFSLFNNLIKKNLLDSADKIIVSNLDYFENNPYKYKFIEIPFGSRFSNVKADPVKSLGSHGASILFVGALDKAHSFKGVGVLLKSFKKVLEKNPSERADASHGASIKLNIVGGGDMRETYIKQADDLGIIDKVNFVGEVSDEELKEYYQNCDIFVLPSIDSGEAFGLVLVEAMSFAKPVIASNLPGVRTVCENNINGFLVEPGDVDDLADKMLKLIQDRELAQKMGQKGRELVDKKYFWSVHVKKLEKVFHS